MKREFGKKLIEEYLPRVDLTHVIDTSGAYIPGTAPRRHPVRAPIIRGEPNSFITSLQSISRVGVGVRQRRDSHPGSAGTPGRSRVELRPWFSTCRRPLSRASGSHHTTTSRHVGGCRLHPGTGHGLAYDRRWSRILFVARSAPTCSRSWRRTTTSCSTVGFRVCGDAQPLRLQPGQPHAPVIKLPEGASEDDHLALLGLLNSSAACFWMKQVFHNKGNGGHGRRHHAMRPSSLLRVRLDEAEAVPDPGCGAARMGAAAGRGGAGAR
jgi:hypothetical protein